MSQNEPLTMTAGDEEILRRSIIAIPLLEEVFAELDATRARLSAVEAASKLWECDKCGFKMSAEHSDPDGTYSCPNCDERLEKLEAELAKVRPVVEAAKAWAVNHNAGDDVGTDAEEHALADAVAALSASGEAPR
jgi:predicted RNA-binding Zn-ribbon protein involved in translation (DUF1610 family)